MRIDTCRIFSKSKIVLCSSSTSNPKCRVGDAFSNAISMDSLPPLKNIDNNSSKICSECAQEVFIHGLCNCENPQMFCPVQDRFLPFTAQCGCSSDKDIDWLIDWLNVSTFLFTWWWTERERLHAKTKQNVYTERIKNTSFFTVYTNQLFFFGGFILHSCLHFICWYFLLYEGLVLHDAAFCIWIEFLFFGPIRCKKDAINA